MDVLQAYIVGVPGETSARPLTSVLVARGPFMVFFAPNGVWKMVKCGVFFARNQIPHLRIWKKMVTRKTTVDSLSWNLFEFVDLLLSFIFGYSLVLAVEIS